MTRAREDFMFRLGLIPGLPLGAWGYGIGGWVLVGAGAAVVFVLASVIYTLQAAPRRGRRRHG